MDVSEAAFQAAGDFSGSCADDMSRLMSLSVPTDIRRQHTDAFIQRYYDRLKKSLAEENLEVPFTLDYVKARYGKVLAVGTKLAFFHIPSWIRGNPATDADKLKMFRRMVASMEDCLKYM